MRFQNIALITGAVLLGACGGEKSATDSAALSASTMTTGTTTTTTVDVGTTPPAAGMAAPITGTTHEVKMIGDATGYRFEPAALTVKAGDGIKWVMVSGGPHNVDFSAVTNAAAKAQIDANMTGTKMGVASSPLVMQPNEVIAVSFANVPAGTYEYICTPHAAMNMKATVTVQ